MLLVDFLIVFTPNERKYANKRFLVSRNTLYKYIGIENANKALSVAYSQITNKTTQKFRKYGKIEIYLK